MLWNRGRSPCRPCGSSVAGMTPALSRSCSVVGQTVQSPR
jgi:hypothetical protein